VIGEQFTDCDQINGIVIQAKKGGDQINVWLRSGKEAVVERVKADFKRLLKLPDNINLEFDLFFKEEAAP
jgi:hypothetical protein